MSNDNKEFAATVLVEAIYTTDEKACKKFGVSDRTLRRWRKALATDPVLSGFVHTKKAAFDREWAQELPIALRKAIRVIGEIADAISDNAAMKRNPNVIVAVAGAIKICAEVHLTGRVIDARIADRDRETGTVSGEVSSAGAADDEASTYTN